MPLAASNTVAIHVPTNLRFAVDPEELSDLLHAYRTLCGDVIARYDGFVARYVGDGILTYFGWPTAHEEDAERGRPHRGQDSRQTGRVWEHPSSVAPHRCTARSIRRSGTSHIRATRT